MSELQDMKSSVVYQIYPKSFCDSNGDGIGDLNGILSKLDYLQDLGVDMLWLTPIYVSPQNDNGYDIADYYAIDPIYGTMEDFQRLTAEAGRRGMGIMMDMVFNHTSTSHPWFKKALSGDSNYQDYYFFIPGKDGGAPTNWVSKFGGSAWAYAEGLEKYYLHLFDVTQADLNWENPTVRRELCKVLEFWMEKGVRGFRFDVVNLISKPDRFEDDDRGDGRRYYTDGPKVHTYLKELCAATFGKRKDLLTVGEMSSTTLEHCVRYTNPREGELSMVFTFHHLKVDYAGGDKWSLEPFRFQELRALLDGWQLGMEEKSGWNAVFWNNHDQPRAVSRFGDDGRYRYESATMLATAIHCLRGTPYLYQGEEIGMTNAHFQKLSQYRDVESLNYYEILRQRGKTEEETLEILRQRSRDNSRTPMQWNGGQNAGFSSGTPWIGVNRNHTEINAESDLGADRSIFGYYQALIRLRKQYGVIREGTYRPLTVGDSVYAYERVLGEQKLLVLCNFYGENVDFTLPQEAEMTCLLGNYAGRKYGRKMELQPYEAVVFGTRLQ